MIGGATVASGVFVHGGSCGVIVVVVVVAVPVAVPVPPMKTCPSLATGSVGCFPAQVAPLQTWLAPAPKLAAKVT
jgi:PAB1-binding protein PBP1